MLVLWFGMFVLLFRNHHFNSLPINLLCTHCTVCDFYGLCVIFFSSLSMSPASLAA